MWGAGVKSLRLPTELCLIISERQTSFPLRIWVNRSANGFTLSGESEYHLISAGRSASEVSRLMISFNEER